MGLDHGIDRGTSAQEGCGLGTGAEVRPTPGPGLGEVPGSVVSVHLTLSFGLLLAMTLIPDPACAQACIFYPWYLWNAQWTHTTITEFLEVRVGISAPSSGLGWSYLCSR